MGGLLSREGEKATPSASSPSRSSPPSGEARVRRRPPRRLIPVPNAGATGSSAMKTIMRGAGRPFSVLSYNILAEAYAHFFRVARWETRKQLLLEEILEHDTDVVALQELEETAFRTWFLPQLQARGGFDGAYVQKIGGAPDGAGIFWRTARFEHVPIPDVGATAALDISEHIERKLLAQEAGASTAADTGRENFRQRVVRHNHVAIGVLLREEETEQDVLVFNTHLFWDPRVPEIKSAQALAVLETMQSTLSRLDLPRNTAAILVGDFNSVPAKQRDKFDPSIRGTIQSGAYELITSGRLGTDHPHHPVTRCEFAAPSDDATPAWDSRDWRSPLTLQSAYNSVLGREPLFTTFTTDFQGTLDYVFFSPQLTPIAVVDTYSADDIKPDTMPSANGRFPSDHTPMIAHFVFSADAKADNGGVGVDAAGEGEGEEDT